MKKLELECYSTVVGDLVKLVENKVPMTLCRWDQAIQLQEQIKFLESQLEALTKDSLDNSMGVSNIN